MLYPVKLKESQEKKASISGYRPPSIPLRAVSEELAAKLLSKLYTEHYGEKENVNEKQDEYLLVLLVFRPRSASSSRGH